jgi:hypothetical protein
MGINKFSTPVGMSNYFQQTGRSEVADVVLEELFPKDVAISGVPLTEEDFNFLAQFNPNYQI